MDVGASVTVEVLISVVGTGAMVTGEIVGCMVVTMGNGDDDGVVVAVSLMVGIIGIGGSGPCGCGGSKVEEDEESPQV